jgi:hypothetical protein
MNFSFYNKELNRVPKIPIAISLLIMALQLMFSGHVPSAQADEDIPGFYRGLLNGYYVELVVDWRPDKSIEGEIWTAAHKVTPRELGFDFAKVEGDNQLSGHLELEIVGDEVSEKNDTGHGKPLGVASLKKTLTGEYIEWTGEYKRATGEKLPMMIYRKRRHSSSLTKPDNEKEEQERSPDENEISGTGSCEEGVCNPVRIEVCVQKKSVSEAREYFEWLKFPVEVPCASPSGNGCVSDSLCTGETWVLEVDGFSEPYWQQELENLPFVISARRTGGVSHDTGIIEMPIASFFSDPVPDHEEAVKNISKFFNEYFSEALADGSVTMTMKERTKFNYIIDILGVSPSLSLRKPGLWEYHQLSIMMSQPYPYDYPGKFAVYVGLPTPRYIEWTDNEQPPSGKFIPIKDDVPSAFLEKMVSAFAHRYRAAVWTP